MRPLRSGALAAGALALLLVAAALIAGAAIRTDTPFFTRGEPREALVVQAIARGEGWILPPRNGDEIPSKPPLMHWLGALASAAEGGVTERSVRLPGLAASLVAAAATGAAAWSWWGPSTATLTVAILVTSFQWSSSSVSARVDMMLASAVTLALLLFAVANDLGRRIPVLAFALLAVATLAKGPVGLVLPVAIVLVTLALRGELRFLERRDALLLAAAAGVAGLWYLAAFVVGGEAFFAKQVLKENVYRFLDPDSVDAGHARPLWYHLPLLTAGLAPWSLYLPGLVAAALERTGLAGERRAGERAGEATPGRDDSMAGHARRFVRMDRHVLLALVWAAVTFALFSLAGSKRAVYLLPAYPAFAMLVARGWTRMLGEAPAGAARALLLAGAAAAGCVFLAFSLVLFGGGLSLPIAPLLEPLLGETDLANLGAVLEASAEHRLAVLACASWTAACATVLWRSAAASRWDRVAVATAAAFLAVSATVATALLPSLAARRSPRDFLANVAEVVPAGAGLSFYRTLDYGAVFYRGAPIPVRQALSDVPAIDGAWLLTWPALLPELREEARRLDTGSETAGAWDVEEVLASGGAQASPRSSLVLVRIARRIGDDDSGGH